jgi:hypothetical protein
MDRFRKPARSPIAHREDGGLPGIQTPNSRFVVWGDIQFHQLATEMDRPMGIEPTGSPASEAGALSVEPRADMGSRCYLALHGGCEGSTHRPDATTA